VKGVLALVVVAAVVAGCGGSSKKSSATVVGTATTENFLSPSFKAAASAQAREISKFVVDLQKNLEANTQTGGALLRTNCIGTVNTEVTQRASSAQEKQIARALVTACQDLTRALALAKKGNAAKAKQVAGQALAQAKLASSASR
jgi:hypothetical protein